MGQININILKKPNIDAVGKVYASQTTTTNCFRKWSIFAKTSAGGWIEFTTPAGANFTKVNPAGPFVAQETIGAGITEWEVEFDPYVSPNASFNTLTTVVTIQLFDTMGGTLLDTEVITHFHADLFC